MGLIEPAMNKRKQEVRSYKMDPLVRSALNKIFQEKNMFDYDPNGNVVENSAPNNKAFLVKDEGKASDDKSRSQQGDQPNLDPEKLFTLFNVNEHSPDAKLIHLVRKKSKDMNVVDWLSKMKSLKVLYLGRWQKSASYHIEVKSTEFFKGLKRMEELKFLSLQGISRIKEIPRSIGMLTNLVVLDLKDCYNLELLPEEISSLTKLRYLDISNCYLLGNMPKELSFLTELQVLKGFIIGLSKTRNLGTLEDLKKLQKLKKLTIIATRNEFPTPTDLGALQELKALQKLTIAWGVQPKIAQEPEKTRKSLKHGKATESSVLKLDKLKKLDLQCFPYSSPTWLKPGDLPKLEKLYIRGGNFTTLEKGTWKVKALRLKYLSGMKTNWRELKELFPKLAYLERVKCPGITLCPCDENGVWQKSKT
nr:disease resistance RPP13-like protein 4 [Quercus suber]